MSMFGDLGKKVEEQEEVVSEETKIEEGKKEEEVEEKTSELKIMVRDVKEITSSRKSAKAKILEQYKGIESDIPINHAYWKMKG